MFLFLIGLISTGHVQTIHIPDKIQPHFFWWNIISPAFTHLSGRCFISKCRNLLFFFLCPLSKHIPVKNLSQFLFYFVFSGIIMEGGAIHLRIQRALHILLSYFLAALGTANCTFLLLLLGLGSVTKHSVSHTFCLFLLGYCPSCTSFFSSSVNQGIFGLLVFLTMLHYSLLQLFVMYMIPKLYV